MEKSLHGLMKTENPDFLAIFGDFCQLFRKCRPSYVKQEMFFQGAKQITPNEGITYILLPRTTHTQKKRIFAVYRFMKKKEDCFFLSYLYQSFVIIHEATHIL